MMWVGRRCASSLGVLFLAALAAVFVVLSDATEARAQDSQGQQSSVAEAARRARQKKNAAAGKSSKVIDDDNLSSNLKTGGADVTNVGASASATVNPDANAQPGANAAATAGDQSTTKDVEQTSAQQGDQSAADEDAEITKVKAQLAEVESELNLLKREFTLDSEAYYSRTNYSSDKAGKAKLDDEQQQIAGKQQELDVVKARLAALQEQRSRRKGKSSAPAPEGEKPATPPQL